MAEVRIGRPTDSVHFGFQVDGRGTLAAELKPGTYDLEVRCPGFRTYKKALQVEQSSEQVVMVELDIGGCSPCVEVVSAPDVGPLVFPSDDGWLPIPGPSVSSLPPECRGQFMKTGVPFFFPAEKGVRYGVSPEDNSSPVPLHIWIDNASDSAITLGSCSMFQDRDIAVWSNADHSIVKRRDLAGPNPLPVSCSADIKIEVAPHSCKTLSELYLNEMYRLPPGRYTVIEQVPGKSTLPRNEGTDGLIFQILK
jgi:hypothetical protein